MPYIKEGNRENIDESIDRLVEDFYYCFGRGEGSSELSGTAGNINYVLTETLMHLFNQERCNYSRIAMFTGIIKNIQDEFNRRVTTPYEEKKQVENGDINGFSNVKF
jgi:hypothetical protein